MVPVPFAAKHCGVWPLTVDHSQSRECLLQRCITRTSRIMPVMSCSEKESPAIQRKLMGLSIDSTRTAVVEALPEGLSCPACSQLLQSCRRGANAKLLALPCGKHLRKKRNEPVSPERLFHFQVREFAYSRLLFLFVIGAAEQSKALGTVDGRSYEKHTQHSCS